MQIDRPIDLAHAPYVLPNQYKSMKKMVSQHLRCKILGMLRVASILLCCLLGIVPSERAIAQESATVKDSRITVNLTNVPLKQAIAAIQKVSPYRFLYNTKLIDEKQPVSINAENEEVKSVLDRLFSSTNISFKIVDRQVILSPNNDQRNADRADDSPKQKSNTTDGKNGRTITGRIVDEAGFPVPGATVLVKNTRIGTSTNKDGFFSILVPEGNGFLTVSFIGYLPQSIALGSNSDYKVALKEESKRLDEVVVTGYQTLSKERATGSFNIVKKDQIEKPTSNIGQRIIGTSAGVQSKTDADGNVTFEIRGITSLNNATAQPLVVVDGFAIESGLSMINPNDVDNITILKDAAAASIWGARSANGVIVVTTKSGTARKGKTKVDFSSFIKVSPKIDLDYYMPYASSSEQVDFTEKAYKISPSALGDGDSYLTGGYNKAYEVLNEYRLGYITEQERDNLLNGLRSTSNRNDIKRYQLQNPFTQQYNLSVLNSTEKSSNMVSLLYEGNKANFIGNESQKYVISAKTNVSLYKWLDFSFNGTYLMKDASNNGEVYNGSSFNNFYNEDGSYAGVPNNYYMPNMRRYVPMEKFPYADWTYNPIRERNARGYTSRVVNARAQAGFTIKPIAGLALDSKVQYEIYSTRERKILTEESFEVRSNVNYYSTWNKTANTVVANIPKGGFRDESSVETRAITWRNQLNFNKVINDVHSVSFIAGSEILSRDNESTVNPRVYGYNDNLYTTGVIQNAKVVAMYGYTSTIPYLTTTYKMFYDRFFSAYANGSYTYRGKYTVSGSARADASNLITDDPAKKYSPFWSVGGSWNVSREAFMEKYPWIDLLLVRATYGFNGNVDKTTSPKPLISLGASSDIYTGDYNAYISSFGNPDLTWEKTGTVDFGVDFDLFDGKLSGKVDFYNKKGDNLLVYQSIPATNGTTEQKINSAQMVNRGIEVELGSSLKIADRIGWRGSINFAYNHNKITDLYKKLYSASELYGTSTSSYVQGYDANTLWAFKYAGVVNVGTAENPNWQPVVQGKGGELYDFTKWTPGDGRDFMLNMGTKVAPYSFGLSNTFKVYDFDLSFLLTGKFGHVFRGYKFNYPYMSGSGIPNDLYEETLKADPMKRVPIPFDRWQDRYYFWDRFYPYLDYVVQNANHIRCQELSLSYNLPTRILQKVGFASARLYFVANNLFLLQFNDYNEDPEFPRGVTNIRPQATYTFGLNVSL